MVTGGARGGIGTWVVRAVWAFNLPRQPDGCPRKVFNVRLQFYFGPVSRIDSAILVRLE